MTSAANKRLALSKEQRSVLEAVYAIEKLPDAQLRDRLSKYLNLSCRQIQVWFQNRRQRAKTNGGASPKKAVVSTPSQIMDALFEFSGTLAAEEAAFFTNAMKQHGGGATLSTAGRLPAAAPPRSGSGSSEGSGTTPSPPPSTLDYETFDWGLGAQPLPPLSSSLPTFPSGAQTPVPVRAGSCSSGLSLASSEQGAPVSAMHEPPAAATTPRATSEILDAVLGFACHEMGLDAIELWPLPTASGPADEPLFAHFASPEVARTKDLACCRAMLAPRLCESSAASHELAWYGVTAEQRDAFMRTGVSLHNLVGIPCLEPPSGAPMAMPTPTICAILVLYARRTLPQSEAFNMLLHALGSAAASAYTLGISLPKSVATASLDSAASIRPQSQLYQSIPSDGPANGLSWLLLAAARALQVDIAEHWTAKQLPPERGSGVVMVAEQLLLSDRTQCLAETVTTIGINAEAHHPFSSHMTRASLFAGKLVWCNGTSHNGVLEGLCLPMRTAVGLPMRSPMGGGAAFVLYAQHRVDHSTSIAYFLAQLQVLAAATQALALHQDLLTLVNSGAISVGGMVGGTTLADVTAGSLPEAVMDTDQVLSLIEGLGDKSMAPQMPGKLDGEPPCLAPAMPHATSYSPIPASLGCSSLGLSMPSVASIEDSLNALADAHADDADRRRPHPPSLSAQLRMDGSGCVANAPRATVPPRQHAQRPEELALGVYA